MNNIFSYNDNKLNCFKLLLMALEFRQQQQQQQQNQLIHNF
jgi:hypothetical protein